MRCKLFRLPFAASIVFNDLWPRTYLTASPSSLCSPAPAKLAGGFIEALFKLLVYFSFSAHLRYEKVGLYLCESVCVPVSVSPYVCECVCVYCCVGVFARQHFRN